MKESSSEIKNKNLKLSVMEALQEDAYKGIARIDAMTMKQLGVQSGDIISIKGERESVAIVDEVCQADGLWKKWLEENHLGEHILRIDGIIRRNVKTVIGGTVIVNKIDTKEAKEIVVEPTKKGVVVQVNLEYFKKELLGRAIVVGDLILLGTQRRNDSSDEFDAGDLGSIFGEVFGSMGMNLGESGGITFVVESTNPKQPVIITDKTQIKVTRKSTKEFNEEDIREKQIIEVTTLPNMKKFLRVKSLKDIFKFSEKGYIINKYEDKIKKIYFVSGYFYEVKK
ncbi:MAG: hypothetical protein NTX24_02620 [Candidatus Pacearchaeota archaeon]|nr:hypothetical protein [Candidatus Pacearchaeota archaeon]